jgi:thiosulfate reductase cytochrome b subunit
MLYVILILVLVGVGLWVLNALPGIDANMKQVIRVLIIAVAIIYVVFYLYGLVATGDFPRSFRIPHR